MCTLAAMCSIITKTRTPQSRPERNAVCLCVSIFLYMALLIWSFSFSFIISLQKKINDEDEDDIIMNGIFFRRRFFSFSKAIF